MSTNLSRESAVEMVRCHSYRRKTRLTNKKPGHGKKYQRQKSTEGLHGEDLRGEEPKVSKENNACTGAFALQIYLVQLEHGLSHLQLLTRHFLRENVVARTVAEMDDDRPSMAK